MKNVFAVLLVSLVSLSPVASVAQALPTATGPGSYVAVGGGVSGFQTDYGRNRIGGAFVLADVQPTWRFGLEGEARFLRWHAQQEVTETNYLGGVRAVVWPKPGHLEPYVKLLAGAGKITLPYGYAHGGFLTYAPGAGLDINLNDLIAVRVLDFEYQHWPQFPYGPLHPYGVSTGLRLRLSGVSRYPKGRRARQ